MITRLPPAASDVDDGVGDNGDADVENYTLPAGWRIITLCVRVSLCVLRVSAVAMSDWSDGRIKH